MTDDIPNTTPRKPWYLPRRFGREQVGDGGEAVDHDHPTADALDGPEGDQLVHGLAEAREDGADQEDDDAGHEEDLAAVDVREAADNGHGGRGRDEVGGRDPGEAVEAAQVGDDPGHGGGDDCLVQRREEQREEKAGHRQDELTPGKLDEVLCYRLVGYGRGCGVAATVSQLTPLLCIGSGDCQGNGNRSYPVAVRSSGRDRTLDTASMSLFPLAVFTGKGSAEQRILLDSAPFRAKLCSNS